MNKSQFQGHEPRQPERAHPRRPRPRPQLRLHPVRLQDDTEGRAHEAPQEPQGQGCQQVGLSSLFSFALNTEPATMNGSRRPFSKERDKKRNG